MNLRLQFPRRWWMRSGVALKGADRDSVSREDQARILGAMIRERRELLGLRLRDLATQMVMWNGVPLQQVARLAGVYRVERSSL